MQRHVVASGGVALLMIASGGTASAQRLHTRIGAASPFSECFCRADGRLFAVGEATCLAAGEERRQAICGMDQNVTSWRTSERPCPES